MDEETREMMEEFKKAVTPAAQWLNKHGDLHQKIIIEMDKVTLLRDELGIPMEAPD